MGFGKSSQKSNQDAQSTQNSVSTSQSNSSNQAYPVLQSQLGDQVGNAGKSSNAILDLLGINGAGAQTTGFDNFRNSSGYDFIKNEGIKGIENSKASQGLLNSGSALKSIAGYSSNLANNFLNQYLSSLMGVNSSGLQAGSLLAGAGNVSNSSSSGVSNGQSTSTGSSAGKSFNFTTG